MKAVIPNYREGSSIDETFNKLSKVNQKLINDFLKYCQISSVHDKTQDKIKRKIVCFADVVEEDLSKFNLDKLRELIPIINKSDKSKDYKDDLLKQIKRFLKWKFEDWSIRFKEFSDFKYMEKGEKKKTLKYSDLFTPEEINQILKSINDPQLQTIIVLLHTTASRPEEILNLTFRDIDYKNKILHVYSKKTKQGRDIPLSEEALSYLRRYEKEFCPDTNPKSFIFTSNDKPLGSSTLTTKFSRLQKKLKLKKQFFPYILRHSTLQHWRLTLDPETYQKVSGHSIETALNFYGHLDSKQIKKQFNEKIFKAEELPESKREELEKEIENLKATLKNVVNYLQTETKKPLKPHKPIIFGGEEF